MIDTFSQIYIQVIFAVKGREYLIDACWEEKLYKYISGMVKSKHQKIIAINGMPDHIHFLIGIKPSCCICDLVNEIKKSSMEYVREQQFTKFDFQWQNGYSVFSYHHSPSDSVVTHIQNQKKYHEKKSFKEEYIKFLNLVKINFKEEYLFSKIEYTAPPEPGY